jgi:hypothetical protein
VKLLTMSLLKWIREMMTTGIRLHSEEIESGCLLSAFINLFSGSPKFYEPRN